MKKQLKSNVYNTSIYINQGTRYFFSKTNIKSTLQKQVEQTVHTLNDVASGRSHFTESCHIVYKLLIGLHKQHTLSFYLF